MAAAEKSFHEEGLPRESNEEEGPPPHSESFIKLQNDQLEKVQKHKYRYARLFVIEFLSYIVFLLVFMVVTYSFRSSWAYWNSEVIRDNLFRATSRDGFGPEFETVSNVEQFWDYFEGAFFPGFYPETSMLSGKPLSAYEKNFIVGYNYRVGAMRWRQVRIKQSRCSIDIAMAGFFQGGENETYCYPKISEAEIDTAPFPPGKNYFNWSSSAELCAGQLFCTTKLTGMEGENTYTSSGYVWDFPNNYSGALHDLRFLKDSGFVSPATRAIIIDFTLFNPGIYIVLACQMRVEFYPTGQLLTHSSVKPMPLMTLEVRPSAGEVGFSTPGGGGGSIEPPKTGGLGNRAQLTVPIVSYCEIWRLF